MPILPLSSDTKLYKDSTGLNKPHPAKSPDRANSFIGFRGRTCPPGSILSRWHSIYTHNTDELIAARLHGSRYMGDRHFSWLGLRPVSDTVVELDEFTDL